MRKNWKRFLALTCAAAMVIPSAAPMSARAAEELGGTIGDSIIENDNSDLPDISNVVLSTITDGMYDFKVDREKLLSTFDSVLYDSSSSMFFSNESNPITFELPADYRFYIKSMELVNATTSTTTFITELAMSGKTLADLEAKLDASEYYVWQPTDSEFGFGEGVFNQITSENYTTFMTVELDASEKITNIIMEKTPKFSDVGEAWDIWDGEVYKPKYTEATSTIVDYFSIEDWAFDESIYVAKNGTAPYYSIDYFVIDTEITTPADRLNTDEPSIDVKVTEAKVQYKNKSLPASITNKSTFDIAVTASVQMTGGEGLTLSNTASISGASTPTIYLAVEDAGATTKSKALAAYTGNKMATNMEGVDVPVTAEAEAYYVLKGTSTDSVLYTLGEIDDVTMSNIYYRYLEPADTAANKASFVITGATDTTASTTLDAVWDEYVESIVDGTVDRPQINIVYSFEKVTAEPDGTTNKVFVTDELVTFKDAGGAAVSTAGWVDTRTEIGVTFADTLTGFAVSGGSNDIEGITITDTDEVEIKSIKVGSQVLDSTLDYSETDGAVKLLKTSPALIGVAATVSSTESKTLEIVLDVNGVTKAFTKSISITGTTATAKAGVTYASDEDVLLELANDMTVAKVQSVTLQLNGENVATGLVEGRDYSVSLANGKVTLLTNNDNVSTTQSTITNITTTGDAKVKVTYKVDGKDVVVEWTMTVN